MKRYERLMTREQWFDYYVARYCKYERDDSMQLALWYLLLVLDSGDER